MNESIPMPLPIEYFDYSTHTYLALKRQGVNTVSDMLDLTLRDIINSEELDNKAIQEIFRDVQTEEIWD